MMSFVATMVSLRKKKTKKQPQNDVKRLKRFSVNIDDLISSPILEKRTIAATKPLTKPKYSIDDLFSQSRSFNSKLKQSTSSCSQSSLDIQDVKCDKDSQPCLRIEAEHKHFERLIESPTFNRKPTNNYLPLQE
jgi:hypothetical protein